MVVACAIHLCALLPHTRREIDLTTDDGMDALRLCFLIESNGAVHNAVIGHSDRIHAELLRASNKFLDAARTVEQTVLCMHMQMCKGHASPPFRSFISSSLNFRCAEFLPDFLI